MSPLFIPKENFLAHTSSHHHDYLPHNVLFAQLIKSFFIFPWAHTGGEISPTNLHSANVVVHTVFAWVVQRLFWRVNHSSYSSRELRLIFTDPLAEFSRLCFFIGRCLDWVVSHKYSRHKNQLCKNTEQAIIRKTLPKTIK